MFVQKELLHFENEHTFEWAIKKTIAWYKENGLI